MKALAICGPARSGKGTVKKWLLDHTNHHAPLSTSEFYWLIVMGRKESALVRQKQTGKGREQLAAEIDQYNVEHDGTQSRLYFWMIHSDYTVVEGIRRYEELKACAARGLMQQCLWVDAVDRLGEGNDPTLDYGSGDAAELFDDFAVLNNNGTPADLDRELRDWCASRDISVKG